MKRCPACDRTYRDEEELNFCLDDGTLLMRVEAGPAPGSQQTLRIPAGRQTEQGRTEVLYPGAQPSVLPPSPPSQGAATPDAPPHGSYAPAAMGAPPRRH